MREAGPPLEFRLDAWGWLLQRHLFPPALFSFQLAAALRHYPEDRLLIGLGVFLVALAVGVSLVSLARLVYAVRIREDAVEIRGLLGWKRFPREAVPQAMEIRFRTLGPEIGWDGWRPAFRAARQYRGPHLRFQKGRHYLEPEYYSEYGSLLVALRDRMGVIPVDPPSEQAS